MHSSAARRAEMQLQFACAMRVVAYRDVSDDTLDPALCDIPGTDEATANAAALAKALPLFAAACPRPRPLPCLFAIISGIDLTMTRRRLLLLFAEISFWPINRIIVDIVPYILYHSFA